MVNVRHILAVHRALPVRGVVPPMTASFKVGMFTPLKLNNAITFASQNSSDLDVGRRPELKSDETCDANVMVIEITSQLCLKPLKQVVQLFSGGATRRYR